MWEYILYIVCIIGTYLIWNLSYNTPDFVKYYAKFTFYIISTLVVSVLTIPIMAFRPKSLKNAYMYARIMQHTTKVLGVSWHYRNGEMLVEKRAVIGVCNHQSSLDILAMYNKSCAAKRLVPVCRKEILYLVPFSLVTYLSGCVFIDRKTPEIAYRTLKASAAELFKKKAGIFMFPEGTRNKGRVKMQPFKKGAFRLAIDCQVPILPIVISPYYFLDAKKKIFNKGHVIVQCLDLVPTTGLTMDDLPELKDRVQNMMEIAYEQLGKEIANITAEN